MMRRPGRLRSGDAGPLKGGNTLSAAWLLTFTDLVGLLLTFFVMLFAMSTPDHEQWEDVVMALLEELDSPITTRIDEVERANINIDTLDLEQAINLDYLAVLVERQAVDVPELRGMILTRLQDQLILTLPAELLFASGAATPTPTGEQALFALGGMLARLGNAIEVFGHTDPNPIRGGPFASNWELSLARAQAVADHLASAGYRRQITVQGFAEGRFGDISRRIDGNQRYALARRVDIAILSTGTQANR